MLDLDIFENELQLYMLRSKLIAAQRVHFSLPEIDNAKKIISDPLLNKNL